jgi:hypothetical protein
MAVFHKWKSRTNHEQADSPALSPRQGHADRGTIVEKTAVKIQRLALTRDVAEGRIAVLSGFAS